MQDEPSTLWKARRGDEELECRARLVPYGIEVDILRNHKLALTRTFETDTEALAWAEHRRATRTTEGWIPQPVESSSSQRA